MTSVVSGDSLMCSVANNMHCESYLIRIRVIMHYVEKLYRTK